MNDGSAPQDRLERWYRRLLRAYPRRYRRQRGEEMLTTLLDSARSGQTRPTPRVAAGLILAGLRYRLRIGRHPAAWIGAVGATIVCGVFGATAEVWLGWHLAAQPLPDEHSAAAMAAVAVPQTPQSQDRYPFLFGPERHAGTPANSGTYTAGSVQFTYQTNSAPGPSPLVAAAGDRLRAAGWSVDRVRYQQVPRLAYTDATGQRVIPDATMVTATKNGVRITIMAGRYGADVRIERAEPLAVPVLFCIGLLVGGLAGWSVAGAVSRRAARQPPGWQAIVGALSIMALGTLTVVCLFIVGPKVESYLKPLPGRPESPLWAGLMAFGVWQVAAIGTVAAAAAVLISALGRRQDTTTTVPA